MRKILYVCILALPVMVFACERYPSFPEGIKSPLCYQTAEEVDKREIWHDHELRKEIKAKLAEGWSGKSFDNVDVTVSNGVVTIRGVAVNEQEKLDIENEIKEIPEVKAVDNQLELKSD